MHEIKYLFVFTYLCILCIYNIVNLATLICLENGFTIFKPLKYYTSNGDPLTDTLHIIGVYNAPCTNSTYRLLQIAFACYII